MFKKFSQYITEEFFFTPKVTTNRTEDQTSLKQAYPDAENADDNDDFNPSIINKNAEEGPNGDVAFISKHDKTKGGEIDTFGNRTKQDGGNGQSILSQSGVSEGGMGDNQAAGQRVYTQTVDNSKQGYQDAMYYDDEDVDSHGEECECADCIEKYS